MADEESTRKIIEETIKEYVKKRNYNWTREHPGIVENLAVILGAVTLLSLLACGVVIGATNETLDSSKQLYKIIVKDSSCQQLKTYLHDFNSEVYGNTDLIKDEITARC